MAIATYGIDYGSGGVALKAAALVAADTAETAVFCGRGWMAARIAWTACEIVSNDELYVVLFQANTAAATSTYVDLVSVPFGATEVTGGQGDTPASGEMWLAFFNPGDHQVRVNTLVNGTIATGMNFSVDVYPLNVIGAY
jgi:hypothetical protein